MGHSHYPGRLGYAVLLVQQRNRPQATTLQLLRRTSGFHVPILAQSGEYYSTIQGSIRCLPLPDQSRLSYPIVFSLGESGSVLLKVRRANGARQSVWAGGDCEVFYPFPAVFEGTTGDLSGVALSKLIGEVLIADVLDCHAALGYTGVRLSAAVKACGDTKIVVQGSLGVTSNAKEVHLAADRVAPLAIIESRETTDRVSQVSFAISAWVAPSQWYSS